MTNDQLNQEPLPVTRKKVLLRLLAQREAERLGITPSDEDVESFALEFRGAFGMHDNETLCSWLKGVALTHERFYELLRELLVQVRIEEHFSSEIECGISEQQAIWTAHSFARSQPTNEGTP